MRNDRIETDGGRSGDEFVFEDERAAGEESTTSADAGGATAGADRGSGDTMVGDDRTRLAVAVGLVVVAVLVVVVLLQPLGLLGGGGGGSPDTGAATDAGTGAAGQPSTGAAGAGVDATTGARGGADSPGETGTALGGTATGATTGGATATGAAGTTAPPATGETPTAGAGTTAAGTGGANATPGGNGTPASRPPVIDAIDVVDRSSGGDDPTVAFAVDWSVSDPDGDLRQVAVRLIEADDSQVVDVKTFDTATNTATFTVENGSLGTAYEVVVAPTDQAGTTATERTRVVAGSEDDATAAARVQ
jgi:preprotein translocase subunit SecG